MEANEHTIHISKKARYYTFGKDITRARTIWFACHGYGQLGKYFVRNFHHLDPDLHFVVAPEGMHRFYLDGFSGRVGATWMTKEARLEDIEDYITFLDAVCVESGIAAKGDGQKLIAFGFSQGVATIVRWIAMGGVRPDQTILWSGSFPPDLEPISAGNAFKELPVLCCIGDEDQLVKEEQILATKSHLNALDITPKWLRFKGGHSIPKDALDEAFRLLS